MENNELDKAETELTEALCLAKSKLKTENDSLVTNMMFLLGKVQSLRGNHQKAINLYERVFLLEREILQTEFHPNICASLILIAMEWQELGNLSTAIFYIKKVLEIQYEIYNISKGNKNRSFYHTLKIVDLISQNKKSISIETELKELKEKYAKEFSLLNDYIKEYDEEDEREASEKLKNNYYPKEVIPIETEVIEISSSKPYNEDYSIEEPFINNKFNSGLRDHIFISKNNYMSGTNKIKIKPEKETMMDEESYHHMEENYYYENKEKYY